MECGSFLAPVRTFRANCPSACAASIIQVHNQGYPISGLGFRVNTLILVSLTPIRPQILGASHVTSEDATVSMTPTELLDCMQSPIDTMGTKHRGYSGWSSGFSVRGSEFPSSLQFFITYTIKEAVHAHLFVTLLPRNREGS